ncbi:MAG: hypothetical protein J1E39_02675 [Eubacterium sp.]|nr:hypothetical protein [Eubacterium sp.]
MSIMKKAALLSAAFCVMLSGCSMNMSVDTLLSPPKLSDEQTEIYTALTEAAGNVDLRYPRMGEYLSAFVINDLDADGSPEAMVFFERRSSDVNVPAEREAGLRIGFLDRDENGDWRSVYEMAASGTEVESVEFSTLGSDSPKAIITYAGLSSQEKRLSIIGYSDGAPYEAHQMTVSQFCLSAVSEDNGELLLTLTRATQTMPPFFTVYGFNSDGSFTPLYAPIALSNNIADFDRFTTGYYSLNGTPMFCAAIDYLQAENQYSTELVYFNGNGFVTANSFLFSGNQTSYIRRTNSYTPKLNSRDINGDGILDVPMTSVLPGYESLTFPEQLNAVWWFSQESGNIERVATMFVDPQMNYTFTFPGRWEGVVTVTWDAEENTVTFWRAEEDGSHEFALLTIKTIATENINDYDENAAAKDSFKLFAANEDITVYVKNIEYQGLSLTYDEVAAALYVISDKEP